MTLYIPLFFFAVLPGLLWLFYYLKKDVHPEPKNLLFFVFLAGSFAAVVGYFFQVNVSPLLSSLAEPFSELAFLFLLIQKFGVIAFSEELLKYLAFFFPMRGHHELDEPIDFVIYMITAAMGFATVENLLLFSSLPAELPLLDVAYTSFLRFVTATFLHALASGILGVFIAYSWRFSKTYILAGGLLLATLLHGIYNFFVIRIEEPLFLFALFFLLVLMGGFLSLSIKRLKKLKSTCL